MSGVLPWTVTLSGASGQDHPPGATVENVLQGGHLPYHEIFPRGLLQLWIEKGWATEQEELKGPSTWWNCCAPILEDVWNFYANWSEARAPQEEISLLVLDERFRHAAHRLHDYLVKNKAPLSEVRPYTSIPVSAEMIQAACESGLRSYDQGMTAGRDYLARNEGERLVKCLQRAGAGHLDRTNIERVELACLKEGHTSSIIRVVVWGRGEEIPALFCLNAARDFGGAASELRINCRDLEEWAASETEGVAQVYDSGEGRCAWFGREALLPIVAVKWFDKARELHFVRNQTATQRGSFVLVEEFRQASKHLPALVGPMLSEEVSDSVWESVITQRTRLAHINWQSGVLEAPSLEINHGDVVGWWSGGRIHIAFVASTSRRWRGGIGAWPYEVSLASARDSESALAKRIYWGKPIKALRALVQGISKRPPDDGSTTQRLAAQMFEEALKIKPERLASILLLSSKDEEGLSLIQATQCYLRSGIVYP